MALLDKMTRMSNSPPSPSPEPPPARPAKPQPKPQHGTRPPDPETAAGSGSATGFVGMLAKRQFDADVLSATFADEAARRQRLHMAREITPPNTSSTPSATPSGTPSIPPAPTSDPLPVPAATSTPSPLSLWPRLTPPLSIVLAILLLIIGIWAIGALFYMSFDTPTHPRDVHYPLISWRLGAGYTRPSRIMAWAMLFCLPLSALLILLARMLRQRSNPR
jgi:hypothetical protein